MKLLPWFLFATAAFAGQSIQYGTGCLYINNSIPTTPTNRLEFYIHDWSTFGVTHLATNGGGGNATGWSAYVQPFSAGNVILAVSNAWDNGSGTNIPIGNLAVPGVYVRMQHDPVNKLDLYEAWDVNGNRIFFQSIAYSVELDAGRSFQIGDCNEPGMSIAFLRVQTTLVPLNSRPPVTFDPDNRLFEWKFDGNLTDVTGHGYNINFTNGVPAYVATPNQNVIAVLKSNANSWTGIATQRAGYPDQLDGTSSFSEADSSSTVSWFWQQLSGPSRAFFSSRSSGAPILTGTVFGDYQIQLTVTDVSNNQAIATADIGVVAMDSKGVVVNADTNVDALFGNLIAFGKNPWGFADYWEQHAMTLRAGDYTASGFPNLQWENTGAGTVSYYWNGVGFQPGNSALGTTLSQSIGSASTTLQVSNASRLDLTALPTRILMVAGNYPGNAEEIRICSATGNTLTVCYDGRGQSPQGWNAGAIVAQEKVTGTGTHFVTDPNAPVCPAGAPGPTGPSSFSAGSVSLTAGSATVIGTGTNWPSTYNGSNGSIVGYYVRIPATHGGTPFWFITQNETGGAAAVASVSNGVIYAVRTLYSLSGQNYVTGYVSVVITDPTGGGAVVTANLSGGVVTSYNVISGGANYTNPTVTVQPNAIVLNRPYPADADSGTFIGYSMLSSSRTLVLRGPHAVDASGVGEWMWDATGCESETALYLNPTAYGNEFASGHDIQGLDGNLISGYQYSVTDSTGWINQTGTGGIAFYGESLGSRALYYRSGLTSALNAANIIDNHLIKSPWGNRDGSGFPELFVGGPVIGAFASAILTGGVNWGDLRSYAGSAEFVVNSVNNGGTPNCEYDDTRDTGYAYAWLILSAIYDPDTSPGGFRSRWRNDLATMQADDTSCKRSDSSWANGYLWNTQFGPLTLTANSTNVAGNGLSPGNCTGASQGTGSVIAGSSTLTVVTGTIPTGGVDTLVITGTMGGSPFTGSYLFNFNGTSTTVLLSVLWPGDTGNVTWMAVNIPDLSGNGGSMTAFATGNSDYTDLANNYACIWNSSTSLTLDHPWRGATASNYYGYLANLAGFGQQPFMLGIKSYGMGLMANATDPALSTYAAVYGTFNRQATQWIHDKGVDANTMTTNYGRIFQFCEPTTTSSTSVFDERTPGCNYGTSLGGESTGREQNQELGNAIAAFYINNPGPVNQHWGDTLYGAVWGNSAYDTGNVYADAASDATNINATNLLDGSIHNGKWYGFFAGMGMLHRWPAVRLGGVDPPNYKTIYIPFSLGVITNAAKVQVTVTQPSGKLAVVVCTLSPCAIIADARSGSVLTKVDYLNASGTVIAPGETLPLFVPQ